MSVIFGLSENKESMKAAMKAAKAKNEQLAKTGDGGQLLSSYHLNENEDVVLTISGTVDEAEFLDQRGNVKYMSAVTYDETPNMIHLLNGGREAVLCSLYGRNKDQWVGKKVQIFLDLEVMLMGKKTEGTMYRNLIPEGAEDLTKYEKELRACKTATTLKNKFMKLPPNVKRDLTALKDELKVSLQK